MLKKIFIAFGLATSLAACMAEPSESAPEAETAASEEALRKGEQSRMSTGLMRTYYSDSSFTTAIGTAIRDCDPEYNEFDGESSRYYKDYRYNCPGSSLPGLPSTSCYICYERNDPGQPSTLTCVDSSCPVF